MKIENLLSKKFDLHTHTTFSDGESTVREMIDSAIEKGLSSIGFSDHSYTFFDESYCMKKEKIKEYIKTVNSAKEEYKGKIDIFCGIEQDFYSKEEFDSFDFNIFSVHYLKTKDGYFPIDDGKELLTEMTEKYYSNDIYSLIEDYFSTVSKIEKHGETIVGHFDYITLYNEDGKLFDEHNQRYISSWQNAAKSLISKNVIFEINTGGMTRKGKINPYPSPEIQKFIKDNGGCLIYSSDSHSKETLCKHFK